MTLWDKVRKDVTKGVRQGVSVLKERSNMAADKAGQLAEVGKVRYQIFLLEQKIEKNFAEMGQRIYELIQENRSKDSLSDAAVKKKLAEAKKLERKSKLLQNKMAGLRQKAA